jgi:hypothetical protein
MPEQPSSAPAQERLLDYHGVIVVLSRRVMGLAIFPSLPPTRLCEASNRLLLRPIEAHQERDAQTAMPEHPNCLRDNGPYGGFCGWHHHQK